MARLFTGGFESRGAVAGLEGTRSGAGSTPTFDTTNPRSGLVALKCDSGATNSSSFATIPGGIATSVVPNGTTAYYRAHFMVPALPASTAQIMSAGGAAQLRVRLTPAGNLQLFDAVNAVQIGSDSVATVAVGTWFRVEVALRLETGATDYAELLLDGASVASSSTLALSDTAGNYVMSAGWVLATAPPGANTVVYVDDCAINDDTGADQNSWPGEGCVVTLFPKADSARGANWLAGAGGTTNLFAAVDNAPPVGVAVGSATDTSQVKNAAKDTTGLYDTAVEAYDVAVASGGGGLATADTVTLVQPVAAVGPGGSTAITHGLAAASNPVIAEATLATAATAAGTFPTGWSALRGTVTYAPSVTRSTRPVLRLRKGTSSTTAAMACLMGLLVEYVPAVVAASSLPLRLASRTRQYRIGR